MARRSFRRRVGVSREPWPVAKWRPDEAARQRMEAAAGLEFDAPTWAAIDRVVTRYTKIAAFGLNAPFVDEVAAKLLRVNRAARELADALGGSGFAGAAVASELRRAMQRQLLEPAPSIENMREMARRCAIAAGEAAADVEADDATFLDFEPWARLVLDLWRVFTDAGIPCSAAHGARNAPSRFVLVFYEIQIMLPANIRRSCQSLEALAGAISRTLREARDTDFSTQKISSTTPRPHRAKVSPRSKRRAT